MLNNCKSVEIMIGKETMLVFGTKAPTHMIANLMLMLKAI